MTSRSRTVILTVVVAVVAGLASIGRVLLTNRDALQTLVWAEDGLFPLCVRAHDAASCLIDPFAGYLLFLPRVVAVPVSLVPMDAWPMATNVVAALLAAGAAALAVLVLRSAGTGVVAAGLVALLPTLTPIVGFEAINATGSVYMLLIFVAALAVCFPPEGRFPTVAFAVGAVIVSLTIPSSALLLLPLAVQLWRKRIPMVGGLITGGALLVGLIAQTVVAITADSPRPLNWSADAARGWADTLPSALLTYWPADTALSATGSLSSATAAGWSELGMGIAAAILAGGAVLTFLRNATASGVGLLLVLGLTLGAIPAAAGYANNRYFVIPALLWLAAALIALDRWLPWRRELVMSAVAVLLVALWVPQLPASEFRSMANPQWGSMLTKARASCSVDATDDVAVTFSPTWPFPDAVFVGPTNNVVPCSAIAS